MDKKNFTPESFQADEALSKLATGVGVFDVTGNTVEMRFVNEGYYQMISSSREERKPFFGKATLGAVHPEDRVQILNEAKASIREKRTFAARFRVLTGNGTYRWIGIRANHEPLNKTTERFYAAYYDVDEYVQGKKKLTEILDNIPGGVAIFSSRNGNIRLEYTNSGFYQLHHGTKEYWSKQSIDPVDWLIPEDRNNFIKKFNEVVQGQKKEGSALYRVTGEDGRLHWVSNQFRPAFKANGFEYFYASFTDMDRVKNGDLEILKT